MTPTDRWLLPEGVEEALPREADWLEAARRRLLDRYRSWGYQLVMPPFIEYLESLLTGAGRDLDLQTFKLTDQLTGRLMGVRADMTPQVARIDAHRLRREGPTRLCYLGTVLTTRPAGFGGTRSPLQVGCELYGHAGPESEREVLSLMLETLALCGVGPVHVDLGHVGIFRALVAAAGLDTEDTAQLFDMLQRKAVPEIEPFLAGLGLAEPQRAALAALALLGGDATVLDRAHGLFTAAGADLQDHLDHLRRLGEGIGARFPDVVVRYDLAEARGYRYENGLVFAAYVPGEGQEVARGGRYDGIGRVFGRARPAVGFSTDLKTLMRLSDAELATPRRRICAPDGDDPALAAAVARLRDAGEVVVSRLGADMAAGLDCSHRLVFRNDQWIVEEL